MRRTETAASARHALPCRAGGAFGQGDSHRKRRAECGPSTWPVRLLPFLDLWQDLL